MARYIVFNGVTQYKPGALTRVNTNNLAQVSTNTTGIVGLIGEAEEGAPQTVYTIDDPALAASIFGSGPLADAINIVFSPSNDPRITNGAFRVIAIKTNSSTQSSIQVPGSSVLLATTVDTGATTTSIPVSTPTLVASAHVGRWLSIGTESRRITANTTTTFTVSPGFTAAPSASATANVLNTQLVLTSKGYGTPANNVNFTIAQGTNSTNFVATLANGVVTETSPVLGGNSFLNLKYAGGAVPATGTGTIASIPSAVTVSLNTTGTATLNAFTGMVLQFSDGSQRLISGNTAANPTLITLDAAQGLTTAQQTALVGTTASVRNVTAATATITGANGVATGITSTVSPVADNLAITFSSGQTLRSLVNQINSTTNYVASVPAGVNPDTTLMSSFDFGTRNTAVNVRFDSDISPATNGSFVRDLQLLVDWVNNFSTLATAVKGTVGSTEGATLPAYPSSPIFLAGGTRGVSSNTSFQTAFDSMLQQRVNHVVPLISYDLANDGLGSTATFSTVVAQLLTHVQLARTTYKSERAGYWGMQGSLSQYIAQLNTVNDADVQGSAQKLTVLNTAGNLVQLPEWSLATTVAGMRAGQPEVGTPLTFKFIKTTALSQDSSWNPSSITNANQILQNGGLFVEQVPAGFRIVRDLTTYVQSDNLAFTDGNVRDVVRFVSYDLRTDLENRFTGLKATPATAANMREFVVAKMAVYLTDNVIVPSFDNNGNFVPLGWSNLSVFINGDVATIRISIYPAVGINFTLADIYLQLPRLAA